jgi:hypothetical protein
VEACRSFQDATFLTVHKDIPDELVYKILTSLWSDEGMKEMTTRKKTFKSMNMENNFRGRLGAASPRGRQVLGGERGQGRLSAQTLTRLRSNQNGRGRIGPARKQAGGDSPGRNQWTWTRSATKSGTGFLRI